MSLEQIRAFLEGSEDVQFAARNQGELYGWTEEILREQRYADLGKSGKGVVRRYLQKVTGRSRAQVARLIRQFVDSGAVKVRRGKGCRFGSRYSRGDIE